MNAFVKDTMKRLFRFFSKKRNRYLFFLVLISLIAVGDYFVRGLVRRTFVFYTALEGDTVVEDRMFRRSPSLETDIRRYVDEVFLGPVSQEAAGLFPRDTRLVSLICRGGVVYADFTENSAFFDGLSVENGVFLSFLTLNEGIRRNFSFIKDVKLFIGGNEIFFNEFREIFADPADNNIKTGQKALTN